MCFKLLDLRGTPETEGGKGFFKPEAILFPEQIKNKANVPTLNMCAWDRSELPTMDCDSAAVLGRPS